MRKTFQAIPAFEISHLTGGGPSPLRDELFTAAVRPFIPRRVSALQVEEDVWRDYWYLQLLPYRPPRR